LLQDYDGAVERAVVDIGLSLAGGEIQGELAGWAGWISWQRLGWS